MSQKNMNRRKFFSQLFQFVGIAALAPLASRLAFAEERRRGGGSAAAPAAGAELPMVDPRDPTAQAVNYVEKKSDLKKADLKTERQGVKFDAQHCSGCGFYKAGGKKNGKEAGTCQIFPGKWVYGESWCSSWNKKA